MPNIKPFRTINEHDIINLYRYSGTLPVDKGTFVKIVGSGWRSDVDPVSMLGSAGASYANTVSERYGVTAAVTLAGSGDAPLGFLLYGVRETDENGEKLIFKPRKAAEMGVVVSGQAVPIATKAVCLYSGVDGNPTAGSSAYVSGGQLMTSSLNGAANLVGKFLGTKDVNGYALVKIDL